MENVVTNCFYFLMLVSARGFRFGFAVFAAKVKTLKLPTVRAKAQITTRRNFSDRLCFGAGGGCIANRWSLEHGYGTDGCASEKSGPGRCGDRQQLHKSRWLSQVRQVRQLRQLR